MLVLNVQTTFSRGRLCDAFEQKGICSWWHFSLVIYIVIIGYYQSIPAAEPTKHTSTGFFLPWGWRELHYKDKTVNRYAFIAICLIHIKDNLHSNQHLMVYSAHSYKITYTNQIYYKHYQSFKLLLKCRKNFTYWPLSVLKLKDGRLFDDI